MSDNESRPIGSSPTKSAKGKQSKSGTFTPSEEIVEDQAVSFPVDI
jgi:hypothetical protein